MKQKILAAMLACALLLTACGGTNPGTQPVETRPGETTRQPETTQPVETTPPIQTEPVQTEPAIAEDALSRLRSDMKAPVAATAYLGYWDESVAETPAQYLMQAFPNYWASNSYLGEIDRLVGNYGTLYCVVPTRPDAKVTVNLVSGEGKFPYDCQENLFSGSGEPFFLLNMVGGDSMLEVIVEESDGRKLYWYPAWGEFQCEGTKMAAHSLLADFTIYEDLSQVDTAGADAALEALRADLTEPALAVAYLGDWDPNVSKYYKDHIQEIYPGFWAANDYLSSTVVSYGNYGGIYCVVPRSEEMTVSVNLVSREGGYPYAFEAKFCEKQPGTPFYVLTEYTDDTMLEVVITDTDGQTLRWYPLWSETHADTEFIEPSGRLADFTPPSERTLRQERMAEGWRIPELDELEGRFWISYSYPYGLDLLGENHAAIYDVNPDGSFDQAYDGLWSYSDGYLYLEMAPCIGTDNGHFICAVPILLDPWGYGDLWLGRGEDGSALPYFPEHVDADELMPTVG